MPADERFWQDEAQELFAVLFPIFLLAARQGADTGKEMLINLLGYAPEMDYTADLERWAYMHALESSAAMTNTTRNAFTVAYADWVLTADPLSILSEQLDPMFSSVRAEMAAITMLTAAFAWGSIIVWNSSKYVEEVWIRTAADENVCPICMDVASRNPYTLRDVNSFPPYHVRCRCWVEIIKVLGKAVGGVEEIRLWLEPAELLKYSI